ncbi:rpc25 [Candida oxycetoniae]|uniref:DNA-directed RNA polymerase subunit n=1 Tax=Candida oxycetoniae TaxID=497107 RepID=A0AAI9T0K5_9ASCO|nr:rpc25 [Candida oxycetoniae]KAI3406394.2 rpc25 [Candida oxycetoniae]
MFILSEIQDLVRIPPHSFNIPIQHSITDELNKKLANKIVPNLGLMITTWDLLDIKDGLLKPGDGGSYVEVRFRYIVFKPFKGETLTGWVTKCTAEGIKLRLEFFDDIWVPSEYIGEEYEYLQEEQAWVWKTDNHSLYIEVDEKVRFRVEQENFYNIKPKNSNEAMGIDEPADKAPAYSLTASLLGPGMGCVSWWD